MKTCRDLVKQRHPSVADADFQDVSEKLGDTEPRFDCSYRWSSWVDVPGASGGKSRQEFTCTWDATTNVVTDQ